MRLNLKQRKVKIISEIHPQHMGSLSEAQRMVIQSKLGGADFVKVQLYSSKYLFNDDKRKYIEFSKKEFYYQAVLVMETILQVHFKWGRILHIWVLDL